MATSTQMGSGLLCGRGLLAGELLAHPGHLGQRPIALALQAPDLLAAGGLLVSQFLFEGRGPGHGRF